MQRHLCFGTHVASKSSIPSRSRRTSDTTNDRNEDEQALIELADEFLGIERKQLGRYKWVSLNESLLTALDRWRQRPYFCPYRPYHGKWIMTCKSDVQNRATGGQIRKTMSISNSEPLGALAVLFQHEHYLDCPVQEYLMTCEYYWHHAMDVLKAKLMDPRIEPATRGFCSSFENRMELEALILKHEF